MRVDPVFVVFGLVALLLLANATVGRHIAQHRVLNIGGWVVLIGLFAYWLASGA